MSFTYPRAMPDSGVANQEFDIQRVDYSAPEASGRVGGVQAGFPLWMATWTLGRVTPATGDEWVAWKDTMRGSQRRFLGRDFSRQYPRAHAAGFAGMTRFGGGSFTGAALTWSHEVGSNGDTIVYLSGLPAGFILSHRDYIGFKWSSGDGSGGYDRGTLARVTQPNIADSGNAAVLVEPPLPAWIPSDAIAYLNKPACVMTLVMEGTKLAGIDRRLTLQGTKIAGVQDLRP
jgi:hypothetical protein